MCGIGNLCAQCLCDKCAKASNCANCQACWTGIGMIEASKPELCEEYGEKPKKNFKKLSKNVYKAS